MPQNVAFLQFENSVRNAAVTDTAGQTITFSVGAQPAPSVRVQNLSTATIWVGMGLQSTSSAAVTTQGMAIPPASQFGAIQIFRTGGNLKLAAFCVGATQTGVLLCTAGEGMS
jgi:hypothetical protein